MKILLLSLCLCVAVITAAIPPRLSRLREEFSKTDEELLKLAKNKRVFNKNVTTPMRSAKFNNPMRNPKISTRHSDDLRELTFFTFLDHFSEFDSQVVEFNYLLKADFFTSQNGPIFIYINDGDLFTTQFLDTGLMHDIAVTANAALVTADLRYFRSNLPTPNASPNNLQLLLAQQSVTDIVHLIRAVRAELNSPNSTVILWGTGHGASLAIWAKRTYPDEVQHVWSSSGVFATSLITHEPYESLTRTITEVGGEECATNVRNAFIQFEYLLRDLDWFYVEEALDLCIFIWDFYDEEMAIASHGLIEIIINYFEVYHQHGILNFCADMQSNSREEAFDNFGRWIRHVFTDQTCLQFDYFDRVYLAGEESWPGVQELAWDPVNQMYPFESRPKLWQRCNQLANLPVTVNSDTLFGRLIQQEFWFLYCSESFWGGNYDYTQLNASREALDVYFNRKNPGVDGVIFTNGQLDPNYYTGIYEYYGEDLYVFNIPLHFKSADLFSVSAYDAPQLRDVKNQIREIILRWASS